MISKLNYTEPTNGLIVTNDFYEIEEACKMQNITIKIPILVDKFHTWRVDDVRYIILECVQKIALVIIKKDFNLSLFRKTKPEYSAFADVYEYILSNS